MSRWLQQQVQPKYPDVTILEVLASEDGYYPVSASTCQSWVSTNSLTHPVLRDNVGATSVGQLLGLQVKDVAVLNRDLKIVLKARVTDTFAQNQVMTALGALP